MPADTPSPHRFLAPRAAAAQPTKQKPLSGLRHALPPRTPQSVSAISQTPSAQPRPTTPAKRFVFPQPRTIPSVRTPIQAKEKIGEFGNDTPAQTPPAQALPRPTTRRKFERVESIQDSSQSSAVGTQEDQDQQGKHVVQSIEQEPNSSSPSRAQREDEEEADEMLFSAVNHHKKRRISPSSSPSNRPETAPHTPLVPRASTSHRFKIVPPRTPAPLASIASNLASSTNPLPPSAPHRPQFLLPPPPASPPKPTKPLPEIFSPSRKNAKYLPGGLASTMTSWVIETANTGFAALQRSSTGAVVWGRERDDGVKLRVRISHVATGAVPRSPGGEVDAVECLPGGVVFARGSMEHHVRCNALGADDVVGDAGEVGVMLAGQGSARAKEGVRISKGDMVGIRAPVWDLDLDGETWVVGVDWILL